MSKKRWHKLVCYVYRDGGYAHASNPLHEKLNEPLCNRLDQLRHENGWTMKEFAIRSGISIATLRDLIHGREFPKYVHLLYIAALTGKDVEYWKGLCLDGYRPSSRWMVVCQEGFMEIKGGTIKFVPRTTNKRQL